jgi:hypothetical protein
MVPNIALLVCVLAFGEAARLVLDPTTQRSINGVCTLDRRKWFGGHWETSKGEAWRTQDYQEFGPNGYRTHPGRGFVVSGAMTQCKEDPARPGFVDRNSLLDHCKQHPATTGMWPVSEVDMIHSSKTEQLYPNSCKGAGGKEPKGFRPGSHNATADFFALYYQHCMYPTVQPRYLMEVANECEVKVFPSACDTTWAEMIALHSAVGSAIHAAHAAEPTRPKPLVCGPVAAFPQYEINNFEYWLPNGKYYDFVAATKGDIDCLSIHFYDQFNSEADGVPTDPYTSNFSVHSGGNLQAELDLQEVATAKLNSYSTPLPLLVSEYGGGFKGSSPQYTPGEYHAYL